MQSIETKAMSWRTPQERSNSKDDITYCISDVKELEQEWRNSLPHLTLRGWLEIFPEARQYLIAQKHYLEREVRINSIEIQKKLKKVQKMSGFDKEFFMEFLKVFYGDEMDEKISEIYHIERALEPERLSGFSETQVEQARNYPIKDILESRGYRVRNNFCNCPFHDDKNPSFYIKRRNGEEFAYCFGCGWKGNSIDLLMALEGKSFKDAVIQLI